MGIVQRQTFKNTLVTYCGFGLGAINILFLYTYYLTDDYHGLVAFVLSSAYIMMPLFAFGAHNTIIKFYSSFTTKNNINSFLTLMLIFPLILIIPIGCLGWVFYDFVSEWISKKNVFIKNYVWLIFVVAVCFAYFEIFYAWAKVQFQSVFGNVMKELFHRVGVLILFFFVSLDWITVKNFIFGLALIYIIRTLIMMFYAFSVKRPVFRLAYIPNVIPIFRYAFLIILAGSIGSIILEVDKFMIGGLQAIENVAYYGVAIYISSVIAVPARSMHQITNPITAKLLNINDIMGLKTLYQKSSLNLFIISGLIFILIVLNINELFELIPDKFSGGIIVVFMVGAAKLTDNISGNNNAILFNSNHYKAALIMGICLAVITVVLNLILIPKYGINGAAFATFISIITYNVAKLGFVYYKFKLSPFTFNSVKTFILILVLIMIFYFWDFPFYPIINIALKSILVIVCYAYIVYTFQFSADISNLLNKLFKFSETKSKKPTSTL